ncbi:TPA: hypothetical protein ACT9LC_001592 [Legionella pneumophila]|uniref:hypothetical protein n=1 Tax=Legionella pneumophila TaxID=446 RepID=UPI00047F2C6B|nr:hypothetical protein [Legionella pneumophila]HAT1720513.1 hypothetical protein [Legionella pneumophila]HAT1827466.1 hypothetical protein [Legionella pneumophila]HAT2093847.1 hypothetical protein [Legionella pneumophila]HAT9108513.1 hypothetical protein [Legionella pneumophila subsp. pneumophila]HAU0184357.1 hypothetical protein [Legionella pneumophila]
MGRRNETQFYVFELRLRLTGRYVINNSQLTDNEKEAQKRTFFDRLLKTVAEFKNKYTCEAVIDYLKSLPKISYLAEKYLIQLKDFSYDSGYGKCLFFYADKDIQSPDLYNFETEVERKIDQKDIEGARFVSHLIVRMVQDPITSEKRIFVALEARTHIYPTQLKKILNKNLKEWSTKYSDQERNLDVYPEFEVLAFQSETLEEILATGKVIGINLLKITPVNHKQDDIPFLRVSKSELVLTPRRKMSLSNEEQLSGFKQTIKTYKKDYNLLRVTVDLHGVTKTNEFGLSENNTPEDILQEIFFHKASLTFDKDIINVNYPKIEEEIVTKVIKEVLTDEKLRISC